MTPTATMIRPTRWLLALALAGGCAVDTTETPDPAEPELGIPMPAVSAQRVDEPRSIARPLTLMIGQSNSVGHGNAADVDPMWAIPSTTVTLHSELAFSDAAVYVHYDGPLKPRTGSNDFGAELSLGPAMPDRDIIKCGIGGTNLYHDWNPAGDWPSADDNLNTHCLRYAHRIEAETGSVITEILWFQGEGDATTIANATAYGGELTAFSDLWLAEFPCAWFTFYRLPKAETYADEVRAGELAASAGDWMTMLDVDPLPRLGVHFTSEGYLQLGADRAAPALASHAPRACEMN